MGTPIRENTKFMDVAELKQLLGAPQNSRRLKETVKQFIRAEQRTAYFEQIIRSLRDPNLKSFRIAAETETLIVSGADLDIRVRAGELVINPKADVETPSVHVDRESNGQIVSNDVARQVRITIEDVDPPVAPDAAEAAAPAAPSDDDEDPDAAVTKRRMIVNVRGYDVIVQADEDPAAHETFPRTINIPMPANLAALEKNDVEYYLKSPKADKADREALTQNYKKLIASIRSEMHSRASFAVSCFILVMVGCALGMISRSGNFLSAFAVSVAPALLCITLIVTGQHVCENTPKSMSLGLGLIWSGNGIVMILATILLGKLQRQ
jgi:hypothetical protein